MQELTFGDHEIIVSKTDTHGKIMYGNELFLRLSGYEEHEIIGAPHNIIRHPDMPKFIFKHLWDTIKAGREVNAYVINKTKNGDYYWVYANVTPSFDKSGNVAGYYSVRRKPSQKALAQVKPLYQRLVNAERSGGIVQSQKIVDELLKNYGGRYDQFILSL